MWHWFSGHVSFTLPGNFCMGIAAVRAKLPAWAIALAGQTTPRTIQKKKIYLCRNTVPPLRCPSSSTQSVESGQEPSRASIWRYCQTSPKPPLSLCPRHCQPSQRILPSPKCLPGCFSPSSLPGCPSPGARLPLLPAAGRHLVWRPGARFHPLGAGTWVRDLPRGAGLHHSAIKLIYSTL